MSYIDEVNSLMKTKDATSISSGIESLILSALTNNDPTNSKEKYIHNLINKKTIEATPLTMALVNIIIKQQAQITSQDEKNKEQSKKISILEFNTLRDSDENDKAQQLQAEYRERIKSIPDIEKVVRFTEYVCETIASQYPEFNLGKCSSISKPQSQNLKKRIVNCITALGPALVNCPLDANKFKDDQFISSHIDINFFEEEFNNLAEILKKIPNSDLATSTLSDILSTISYAHSNGYSADEDLYCVLTTCSENNKSELLNIIHNRDNNLAELVDFKKILNDYWNKQLYRHVSCYEKLIDLLNHILADEIDDLSCSIDALFSDDKDSDDETYNHINSIISNIKENIAASSNSISHYVDITKG